MSREQRRVEELDDELQLISDSQDIEATLSHIGIGKELHDPSSIIHEDSFGALFVLTEGGAYEEVWGVYDATARNHSTAVRLY